jgi:UDP-N-acetylglucosamine 2-epimerase (non-hydrolysing)
LPQNAATIDAAEFSHFFALLNCIVIMTDSGGVQEEPVILKNPCITLSNTTVRQGETT